MGNASWVTLDTVDATRVAKNVPSETRTPVTMGEKRCVAGTSSLRSKHVLDKTLLF